MNRHGAWKITVRAPLLALALLCLFSGVMAADPSEHQPLVVKVGMYENPPKIFTDQHGQVTGFWPDLIRAIAKSEDWEIEFVPGTWEEGMNRLLADQIDMMPDVAFTENRNKLYAFSEDPVLMSWTRVYVRRDSDEIQSFLDLKNRKIAALKGSVNLDGPGGLREIARNFHLNCSFLELDDYTEVFRAIAEGRVDAGITNRNFGRVNSEKFDVKETPIIFQPIDMKFAFPKNGRLTSRLVESINAQIKKMQRDGNSIYYRLLYKYFEGPVAEKRVEVVPEWVWNVLKVLAILFVFAVLVVAVLRLQVKKRTRELQDRNRELAESRRFIESVVNLSPEILYIYDLVEKRNVYSNNGIEKILGYTVEEIRAMGDRLLPTLMHPEDFETYLKKTYPRYREVGDDESIVHRYRMKHRNGQWRWLDCVERIYSRGADGSPRQIVGIAVDGSERIEAEQAETELNRRLVTILENMGDAFVSLDKNWHYTYVNRKAGELFGREPESLLGKHIWTEFPEGVGQPFYKAYYRAVEEQREIRLEEFYPPWERWYENRIYPTPDGLSIFFTDITERKLAEQKPAQYREELEVRVQERTFDLEKSQEALLNLLEDMNEAKTELEKANSRLSELDRLKSMFIASMSHELRTPLNSIIGFTGLLLQELPGKLNEEQKKQLSIVRMSSHHLLDLINDIIDISKIEAGKVSLEWTDCPLVSLVESVAETLRPEAEAKGLELKVEPAADVIIKTDARRLSQVLMNLFSNAVKFTESGVVSAAIESGEDGVRVSVSDTGMGMDAEGLSRLFQPFSRIHRHGDAFVPGTGLGLYLSKKLVELMGGRISVGSEPGQGSRFTIFLPGVKEKNA